MDEYPELVLFVQSEASERFVYGPNILIEVPMDAEDIGAPPPHTQHDPN
jgi:hypothetical protein